jgi:hypothetical protein
MCAVFGYSVFIKLPTFTAAARWPGDLASMFAFSFTAVAGWPRHQRESFSPQRVQLDCLATALGKRLVSSPECAAGLPSHGMMDLIVPSKNQMQKSAVPVTELLHKEAFAMMVSQLYSSYEYYTPPQLTKQLFPANTAIVIACCAEGRL